MCNLLHGQHGQGEATHGLRALYAMLNAYFA